MPKYDKLIYDLRDAAEDDILDENEARRLMGEAANAIDDLETAQANLAYDREHADHELRELAHQANLLRNRLADLRRVFID